MVVTGKGLSDQKGSVSYRPVRRRELVSADGVRPCGMQGAGIWRPMAPGRLADADGVQVCGSALRHYGMRGVDVWWC